MLDLSNQGYDVEEVYQSHKSLNESTAGFREQVYCGNVMYLANPLLNFVLSFDERDDKMLCHIIIDLSVVLCARSGDWTILVQR